MPRVRPLKWARAFEAQGMVVDALDQSTLCTAYVLDFGDRVAFVDAAVLGRIGLDREGVRDEALRNIQRAFSRDAVRGVLDTPTLAMIKTKDSYDAARLLAVASALEGDEVLFALVSDDDTLALASSDEAVSQLKRLGAEWYASADDDKKISPEVLRVSPRGVSVVTPERSRR